MDYTAEDEVIIKEKWDDLLLSCTKICKNDEDWNFIKRAFFLAKEAHQGVRRRSGEPYLLHPIAVAKIVIEEIGLGVKSVVAALLHDVVEDTEYTVEDMERIFGPKIASMVDGLTKMSGVFNADTSEQAEYFRKVLLTLSDDVRVILIKIADRLHNMRTLGAMPMNKQIKITGETIYLFAPLAYRLGLYSIKSELEDLCMKYRFPQQYAEITQKLNETEASRQEFISKFNAPIIAGLNRDNINYEISGRVKSVYSIWSKMQRKQIPFEEIYDLFAIRIVFKPLPFPSEKTQCWQVYSTITDIYTPKPDRLRDWISMPKANGYEALHSTVMGPDGVWVEVQIRTERMDAVAERGIAAHWRYKGVNQGAQTSEMWLGRLRELLEDTTHSLAQRFDAKPASGEIFVFTPNGDLRKLPEGASLLDFAFDIHTSLGSTCVGGKVNNRAVSIREQLHNGDIVEILTQKNQTPKSDWLNFVVTSKARNKIKSYLREEQAKHTRMGREELERKLKNWKFTLTIDEAVAYLVKYFKVRTGTEVYALIATQKVDLGTIKEILARHISGEADEQRRAAAAEAERNKVHNVRESTAPQDALVIDDDISKIQYKLAKCCNPIKGDDVFGFVTINSGITIHRNDCPNAKRMRENYPYRVIEARWRSTAEGAFRVSIRIVAADTTGMANHITEVISRDLKLNIRSINFSSLANGCIGGTVSVEVPGAGVVDTLIHSIMRIKGVQRAFRINN